MNSFFRKLYCYVWKEPHVMGEILLRKFSSVIPDKVYLTLFFRCRMGYWMNWKSPATFSEKMQWMKLYDNNPVYSMLADKYAGKSFIEQRVGRKYVIPMLSVWNTPSEVTFDNLPNRFVLKTTHDCGGVVLCDKEKGIDEPSVKDFLTCHYQRKYYRYNRENHYRKIQPRVLAEMYIGHPGEDLKDYKFFCFHGEAKLCQVIAGRREKMTVDFFDREWNHLPFREPVEYEWAEKMADKPSCLSEMIEVAEKLSAGFTFLRVDLYEVDGRVYCGELTLYPTSGWGGFSPRSYDELLGSWIHLPERNAEG